MHVQVVPYPHRVGEGHAALLLNLPGDDAAVAQAHELRVDPRVFGIDLRLVEAARDDDHFHARLVLQRAGGLGPNGLGPCRRHGDKYPASAAGASDPSDKLQLAFELASLVVSQEAAVAHQSAARERLRMRRLSCCMGLGGDR